MTFFFFLILTSQLGVNNHNAERYGKHNNDVHVPNIPSRKFKGGICCDPSCHHVWRQVTVPPDFFVAKRAKQFRLV